VLRVRDLAVSRGGIRLVEGVSFELAPGQALALRGPNGVGKTTLLRCLVGLQRATSGSIEPDAEHFAYAAHADALKSTLTVTENLAFWASVHGTPSIAPALDAFDLRGLADRPAGELSAGQRRRLGLARLVLTGRPIWALDEPTVALDRENVARFAGVLAEHLAGGGMAVIATHIELGLEMASLDLTPFKAKPPELSDSYDEAFL